MAHIEEDEIDLVDYIKVIIKRRGIIVVGTLICILAVYTYQLFFSAKEEFDAKASLLIIPPVVKSELLPNFSVSIYQALAEAQDLTDSLVVRLNLINGGGQALPITALNGAMETELASEEGATPILLDFFVTSSDTVKMHPVVVVNTWAELFVDKNKGLSLSGAGGSYKYIKNHFDLAQKNLTALEDSLIHFDRTNRTEAMGIEASAKSTKLIGYRTLLVNAQIQLNESLQTQKEVSQFLAVMETDEGKWVGAPDVYVLRPRINTEQSRDKKRIFDAVIQARSQLRDLQEKIQFFQFEHDLDYHTKELESQKSRLLVFKTTLVQTGIDAAVIEEVLQKIGEQRPNTLVSPGISSASDHLSIDGVREFVSLQLGVNLFQPRQERLLIETQQLKIDIDSLEAVLVEKQKQLSYLTRGLPFLEHAYQIHSDQYLAKKKQSYDLILSIQLLQQQIDSYVREIEYYGREAPALNDRISDIALQKSRITRNMETYKATFRKFTQLLEDARIAQAGQPEDIRIVARAVVPNLVASESRITILGLAAAIGFMGSVFLAFFVEYWEKAKVRLKEEG